ncbi:MAG: hypothetical protein JNM61_09045 [Zoogloeaceae bacterium]|nr:hypothetical protein [Zoogloeaceae bacterium]
MVAADAAQPGLRARLLGFLFSPRGIVVLASIYLLVGLTGHDPWRGDDSRYFGPIVGALRDGHWLLPAIGGEPYLEYPPLYYWLGAVTAWVAGPFLPMHDGARLASALCIGVMLFSLARAASALFGRPTLSTVCLLALGTLGLVVHAHETQPILAVLATTSLTLAALAKLPKSPRGGGLVAGASGGLSFLAGGLAGALPSVALLFTAMIAPPAETARSSRLAVTAGILLGCAIAAAWLIPLFALHPEPAAMLWRQQVAGLIPSLDNLRQPSFMIQQLGWFLWPLWPIAGWALWRARRQLAEYPWRLALVLLVVTLATVLLLADSLRPANLLPLIPALALIASAGVPSLRRGAASAFDWFAIMTFVVFALLVFLAWTAMGLAWPPGLSRQLVKLAPGFHLNFTWVPGVAGGILVTAWLALVWNAPRSPNRGAINWATGTTLLWTLAVLLLMPWFDHGKSYRPAAEGLAKASAAAKAECVAADDLSPSLRASLSYFTEIRLAPASDWGRNCALRLVAMDHREILPSLPTAARRVWEYRRGGGRQLEVLQLYRISEPALYKP